MTQKLGKKIYLIGAYRRGGKGISKYMLYRIASSWRPMYDVEICMEEEVGIDADLVFIPVLDQRVWARGCQLARFLATQRPQLTLVLVGAEGTRKACGRAELPKSVVQIFVRVKSKKDRITALDHLRRVVLERLAPSGSA